MTNAILDSPLLRNAKPWWHPFLSLSLTLYGIFVLGWNLQPIVVIFWMEIIMMAGAALIRCFFALENRPFFVGLIQRIGLTIGGGFMLGAMLMLAVTFSINAFDGGMKSDGFEKIPTQTRILAVGYILGLALHYFANGRYKTASPIGELMQTFIHLLVLLALLMVLTMHLIPACPQLNQAHWVGLAVVVVKFFVDWGFSRVKKPLPQVFQQ